MSTKINRRQWLAGSALGGLALTTGNGFMQSLEGKSLSKDPFAEEIIKLSANENPYGPPLSAQKAINEALMKSNRYAQEDDLKNLIAKAENLSPENIVLSHGSTEILKTVALLYASNGKELVVPSPTFFVMEAASTRLGAKVTKVPLNEKMEIDLRAIDRAITPTTSLAYVCNPNNPTGTAIQTAELKDFCLNAEKRTTLLVDEAYIELTSSAYYGSMAELVRQGKNIIIARTFSKVFGLAGLRIGYALARPEVAKKMNEFRMGLLNVLGVAAAMAAYKDIKFIEDTKKQNESVRNYFCSELDKLKIRYIPSVTNFVLADVKQDFATLRNKLQQSGNIMISGIPNTNFARFTIGLQSEMEKLVQALKTNLG